MKFDQSFINKELDQYMSIKYNGYNYDVLRFDPDGYKTKLTLNSKECTKFVDTLISHGWEQTNDRRRNAQVSYTR